MCPADKCGPLCLKSHQKCEGESNYNPLFRLPVEGEYLVNFTSPESPTCPERCCEESNEYCFRTHSSSGHEVIQDQEMMLIFGGVSELNVKIGNKKILDDCKDIDRKIHSFLKILRFYIFF